MSGEPARKVRPIGRRVAVATLLTMLGLAVAVTALQWWNLYAGAVQRQQARIDDLGRTFVPSLADAVWQAEPARIHLLLDGIARIEGIAGVRLRSVDGEVVTRGQPPANAAATRVFPLAYEQGRRFDVGSLEVHASRASILAELRERTVSRAVTLLLVLGVGTAVLLALVERRVARPMRRLAGYARALGPATLDRPLGWRRRPGRPRDELDDLAEALERMREALHADVALRARQELELTAHRDRLEDLVRERTQALEAANGELAAQRDAVQRLADTDALTGAASRRRFEVGAAHELARMRRDGGPLSVLMLDIDHFKAINDRHGHAGGDRVLQACVSACLGRVRESDVVGRLGGEEFAILLPGTALEAACEVAEALRATLARLQVVVDSGEAVRLTVSIGVAQAQAADDVDSLLRRADQALYAAKRGGRDRVVAAPRAPAPQRVDAQAH